MESPPIILHLRLTASANGGLLGGKAGPVKWSCSRSCKGLGW
ncbi:hypothetical protein [Dissulfurimicrobium hydrothermale]|nr:hypothetical protein [Dissulfurimicrobium hydrothermale]